MIMAHYAHRLPYNYDVALIRARAKENGLRWDATPEMYFKGFLLRERCQYGSNDSEYSSLYLWQRDEAFRDFLVDGRFKNVTASFGRPEIQTAYTLDARKGRGRDARFAYKQELDVQRDTDIAALCEQEVERNRAVAEQPSTVAAVVAVDPREWRFIRVLYSESRPAGNAAGVGYEVLYFARPLPETLPVRFTAVGKGQ